MTLSVRIGNQLARLPVSSVGVTRSLESAFSQCSLQTFDEHRAALGERAEVELNGKRIFTGSPETYPGTPEQGYSVSAYTLAAGLGRNQAEGTEIFRNTTAGAVVRTLSTRSGVIVTRSNNSPISKFRIRRGDEYRRSVQSLGEAHGFTLTDNGNGDVVLFTLADNTPAVEVWELGTLPVLDIEILPDISAWVDAVRYRGQRTPTSEDVANIVAGQIGVDIVAGNIRPSIVVLGNSAATGNAQAKVLVAQEIRKRLAQAFTVRLLLTETERDIGDVVQIRGRGLNMALVVSSLTWTVSASSIQVEAIMRLPAVYATGALIPTAAIQETRS